MLGRSTGAWVALLLPAWSGFGREHTANRRLGKVVMRVAQHHHAARIHLEEPSVGQRQVQPPRDEHAVEVSMAHQEDVAGFAADVVAGFALVDVGRLEGADLGDDRVDAIAHVLCRLAGSSVGLSGWSGVPSVQISHPGCLARISSVLSPS